MDEPANHMSITQLLVDCYQCAGPLNDEVQLLSCLESASIAVGAEIVGTHVQKYRPHGVTAVVFLAESHAMVTTWPEHCFAAVDIFLCNPTMKPMTALNHVVSVLRPGKLSTTRVVHHVGPRPLDR